MKPMGRAYEEIIFSLENLLNDEHCRGCDDQSTCGISTCYSDGYTLWAIELFSTTGAASDEFLKLYALLPKRFKADAERERVAFLKNTPYATCPKCNAVIWHLEYFLEYFDDVIHCDSCGHRFKASEQAGAE